jgi:hypothetical protein
VDIRKEILYPKFRVLHIEATSDETLGAYSKAEDEAMTTAFGGRGKKL